MIFGIYLGWNKGRGRKCVAVKRKVLSANFWKKMLVLAVSVLGIQILTNGCGAAEITEQQDTMKGAMGKSLADGLSLMLYDQFLPGAVAWANRGNKTYWLIQEQIESLLPFLGYLTNGAPEEEGQASLDPRTIFLAEAEDGRYVMADGQDNEGEETEYLESSENVIQPPEDMGEPLESEIEETMGETLDELLKAENDALLQLQYSSFMPHGRQEQISLETLQDYDILLRQFYTVDANTMVGSDQLNADKLLDADLTISREDPGPQILIYHTHSQEAFSDSVSGDESTSIMGVGDRLTEILTQDYGYEVLHHRGKYDVNTRDDAYSNALSDIEQVLKENPSIQVVIDLHRDEMPEGTRLVMDLDGRPTARFMFFNGLSRTKKTGNIAYLYNENLESNLAFSFQMQLKAMEYYPGLTRRIYLKGYRYNMHLKPRYLLIELGAQNNTVEEAMNACDPLAHILDMVLSGN